ncbi:hypothetical protein BJ508DRAFT_135164 [Ascobolus immersus RN42]|uniref:Uncharacterized protein n=1 Tax=Ascobolus immersus RN42 TaxID=1160509 RepID=A0A3N4IXZ1_ASCIM|nr:hypothetical protein BJ508DRAFT_135164 [Ascobolus immersus RN42]
MALDLAGDYGLWIALDIRLGREISLRMRILGWITRMDDGYCGYRSALRACSRRANAQQKIFNRSPFRFLGLASHCYEACVPHLSFTFALGTCASRYPSLLGLVFPFSFLTFGTCSRSTFGVGYAFFMGPVFPLWLLTVPWDL